MSRERKTEEMLTAHGRELFASPAEGSHLEDARLALDPLPSFTESERAHLASCEECRTIVASRARAQASGAAEVVPLAGFRRRVVPILALAATIAALVLILPRERDSTFKGDPPAKLTAEVTLIATDARGTRRDARSGDKLSQEERLGFKYGNPEGRHSTLAILGWDGQRIHWYYPEGPNLPAQKIEKNPAIGARLPFDIALSDHRAGPLNVVAAFDRDPAELAKSLERGEIPRGEGIGVFELTIEQGR